MKTASCGDSVAGAGTSGRYAGLLKSQATKREKCLCEDPTFIATLSLRVSDWLQAMPLHCECTNGTLQRRQVLALHWYTGRRGILVKQITYATQITSLYPDTLMQAWLLYSQHCRAGINCYLVGTTEKSRCRISRTGASRGLPDATQ